MAGIRPHPRRHAPDAAAICTRRGQHAVRSRPEDACAREALAGHDDLVGGDDDGIHPWLRAVEMRVPRRPASDVVG